MPEPWWIHENISWSWHMYYNTKQAIATNTADQWKLTKSPESTGIKVYVLTPGNKNRPGWSMKSKMKKLEIRNRPGW